MKETKKGHEMPKKSAEDWVNVAREFGEKCQTIQHDTSLNMDQKLEKQKTLSQKMAKEIQEDPHLKPEEKKLMVASIHNYMEDWSKMHDLIKNTAKANSKKPSKK